MHSPNLSVPIETNPRLISGIAVACINKFIFLGKNFITGNKESYKTGVSKKPCPSYTSVTLRLASAYRRVAYLMPVTLQAIVWRIG